MKVEIKRSDYEIDAEEVVEKEVKPFGKAGAHIIVPKKWIGYKVLVVVKQLAGSWASAMKRHSKKKGQY